MWPSKPSYWLGKRAKLLGKGGFGTAYLVTDRDGEQWVLKQYTRLDDSTRQEIETLRALQRDGIAERCGVPAIRDAALVPDWAQQQARQPRQLPSVELEYVRGEDLMAVLRAQRLDPDEVLAIAEDLLETLACLHEAGLVHRDVKLENVIWDDRHARLIDYGFLCAEEEGDDDDGVPLCAEEGPAGTASYAAPELYEALVHGAPLRRATGPEADIWATGVLLWELLSSRAVAPQTLRQVEALPRQVRSGAADAAPLLRLIRAMLQLEPDERPSAAELLERLRAE